MELDAPTPDDPSADLVAVPATGRVADLQAHDGEGHVGHPGLTYAGLLLGGIVLGLFGVVVVAQRSLRGDQVLPWGLALMMVALPVCTRAAVWLAGSRRGGLLVAIGWVLPTLAFTFSGPGADILLPAVTRTYVYLYGGVALVVLAALWPLPRGLRASTGPSPAATTEPASEPAG